MVFLREGILLDFTSLLTVYCIASRSRDWNPHDLLSTLHFSSHLFEKTLLFQVYNTQIYATLILEGLNSCSHALVLLILSSISTWGVLGDFIELLMGSVFMELVCIALFCPLKAAQQLSRKKIGLLNSHFQQLEYHSSTQAHDKPSYVASPIPSNTQHVREAS